MLPHALMLNPTLHSKVKPFGLLVLRLNSSMCLVCHQGELILVKNELDVN